LRPEGEKNWPPPGKVNKSGKLKKGFRLAEIILALPKCPSAEETEAFWQCQYYYRERTNDGTGNTIIY
jgi:hypothetical protein